MKTADRNTTEMQPIKEPHINIKRLRELKNWSQEFMADALGISTRAYSKIEAGETQLSIKRLNEISQILQVNPIKILVFDSQSIFSDKQNTPDSSKLIAQYEKTIRVLEEQIQLLKSLLNLPQNSV